MHLLRNAFATVATIALVGAAAADADAKRWELEFKHQQLRRVSIESPMGHATSYWYMRYTLTNPGEKPVTTRMHIWADTDTPWQFRDSFFPLVEAELEKRYRTKFLNTLDIPRTAIAPGKTVECIAIFSMHESDDLRAMLKAMDHFTARHLKPGRELLEKAAKEQHEGKYSKWVKELLAAANSGLESARAKTEELRARWKKQKKDFLPSAKGEGEDFITLNNAVHDLRIRDFPAALEKLEKVLKDFPDSRFRRQADRFRTLAARRGRDNEWDDRRIVELDAMIEEYLYGYQPHARKDEADTVKMHVSGLYDIVFPEHNKVYRETRNLRITWRRPGDNLYPAFEGYRKAMQEWYVEEGERIFIRNLHENRR